MSFPIVSMVMMVVPVVPMGTISEIWFVEFGQLDLTLMMQIEIGYLVIDATMQVCDTYLSGSQINWNHLIELLQLKLIELPLPEGLRLATATSSETKKKIRFRMFPPGSFATFTKFSQKNSDKYHLIALLVRNLNFPSHLNFVMNRKPPDPLSPSLIGHNVSMASFPLEISVIKHICTSI